MTCTDIRQSWLQCVIDLSHDGITHVVIIDHLTYVIHETQYRSMTSSLTSTIGYLSCTSCMSTDAPIPKVKMRVVCDSILAAFIQESLSLTYEYVRCDDVIMIEINHLSISEQEDLAGKSLGRF